MFGGNAEGLETLSRFSSGPGRSVRKIPGLQMSLKRSKGFWDIFGTSELPVGDATQRRHNKTFVSERFGSF
ncbi:hypothetical protein FQA47_006425 [Oryzias melastigma]|uniref:Uncharacterized protein n=1 Tax=Oryzias melastigma TaxID=30732 RepID=A0A834F9M9_ORYME|nr:hypothetical protein FQA47_006425 [Oryzias melastigma]